MSASYRPVASSTRRPAMAGPYRNNAERRALRQPSRRAGDPAIGKSAVVRDIARANCWPILDLPATRG